jgi:hypothetical protein
VTCEKWRPLVTLRGVCACGQMLVQHAPEVQADALRDERRKVGTRNATATAISANAAERKPFLTFLEGKQP